MKKFKFLLLTVVIFLGLIESAKAEQYSELFKKLVPNRILELNAVETPIFSTNSNYEDVKKDA